MKTTIYPDYSAFLARTNKDENGVSAEFASLHPEFENENASNKRSWNLTRCSDCSDCSDKKNNKAKTTADGIPIIANIHQEILAAVSAPGCFNMKDWHTCETQHCRGGWVVHKAGPAGYALEKATSTVFAAMQIYKASSPIRVSPVRFLETDEVAMADIKRCAAEEAALTPKAP